MKRRIIIISIIVILIGVFVFTYRYYTKQDPTNTLTVREKEWILDNNSIKYDLEILNDYPVYGDNGVGLLFDFVNDFEKEVGIDFNKISYLKATPISSNGYRFRIVNKDYKLKNNDIKFFNDNYVVVSKEYKRINHISDLSNEIFGIFEDDKNDLSYYLKQASNITFNSYGSIVDMINALESKEITSIIVPNMMYLNYTIEKDKYNINYYLNEYSKSIILSMPDGNKQLNTIIRKYYNKWKNNKYVKEYNKQYIDYYMNVRKISSEDKDAIENVDYTYGYVKNLPYENVSNNNRMTGIAGEYIERIKRLGNINIKYKRYKDIAELNKAIKNKEIDIYFDYYNINSDDYVGTNSYFIEDYVVLGKMYDKHVVSSFESLSGKEIVMLKNSALYDFFVNNSKAYIKTYNSINELVRNAKNRIIVIDREKYVYYQNSKFRDYNLVYEDTMSSDYRFMVLKKNNALYDLFNYISSTNSYYNYRNDGLVSITNSVLDDVSLWQLYLMILLAIFIPIIIVVVIIGIIRHRKKIKIVKIKDRHKYTDVLTSLKNRNYLNDKLPEWEECKKFPQSVIVIDLNNVKYVNDNYGHEEGDQLIMRAASKLVNMQLENSEIIRTDGNEFLIYLVGYKEKQISTYCAKLTKELKSLPHDFGAAVGYSMIMDNSQSIDDAINEATLEMITKKEESKSK